MKYKFGRLKPDHPPELHFHDYKTKMLPPPPITNDNSNGVCGTSLGNIFGNDNLGDCVIAGMYHVMGIWTQNQFIPTLKQIIADYSAIGGYVPSDPSTDQGCDEITAFKYWMNKGFQNKTKLVGYLGIDARNILTIKQSIHLLENNYYGISLPDKYVNPMPSKSGFIWDVAGPAIPNNGHCIMAYGYTEKGVLIDTWALRGLMTWAALAKYMITSAGGEAYTLVSQAMLNKAQQKAANGLTWSQLIADFDTLGGKISSRRMVY